MLKNGVGFDSKLCPLISITVLISIRSCKRFHTHTYAVLLWNIVLQTNADYVESLNELMCWPSKRRNERKPQIQTANWLLHIIIGFDWPLNLGVFHPVYTIRLGLENFIQSSTMLIICINRASTMRLILQTKKKQSCKAQRGSSLSLFDVCVFFSGSQNQRNDCVRWSIVYISAGMLLIGFTKKYTSNNTEKEKSVY